MMCLTGHSDRVISLACSKSGRICTSSLDRSVKLWAEDVTSGDVIGHHNGEVTCVTSSWDKAVVVTGSRSAVEMSFFKGKACITISAGCVKHLMYVVFIP